MSSTPQSQPGQALKLPQPPEWYAGDLLQRAKEYLRACQQLKAGETNKDLLYPAYHLVAHATELSLKAYLAASGVTSKHLREKLGHKLGKLYRAAQGRGLPPIEQLDLVVDQLEDLNEEQSLRYPAYFIQVAPRPEDYADVVEKLLSRIGPDISLKAWFTASELRAKHPGVTFLWEDEAGDPPSMGQPAG